MSSTASASTSAGSAGTVGTVGTVGSTAPASTGAVAADGLGSAPTPCDSPVCDSLLCSARRLSQIDGPIDGPIGLD